MRSYKRSVNAFMSQSLYLFDENIEKQDPSITHEGHAAQEREIDAAESEELKQ